MSLEKPKWQPTSDEIIQGKFGQESINEARQISGTIFEQIKAGILNIGMKEGGGCGRGKAIFRNVAKICQ